MNELQELMGDSYKEGMSIEEIGAFFEGKKFADLSTGNYVDKQKYDNTVAGLKEQLDTKTTELNNKLSDEERRANFQEEQTKEIARLKKQINRDRVDSRMISTREILGIAENDTEFVNFIDNITDDNVSNSADIADYVSKIIKKSYEKGKEDGIKNSMGNFGKSKHDSGNQGEDPKDEIGKIGERLVQHLNNQPKTNFDYFK